MDSTDQTHETTNRWARWLLLAAIAGVAAGEIAFADDPPTPAQTSATTQAATTRGMTISWEDAARHVGEVVTATGPVKGVHVFSADRVALNIGKDFPAPDRLSVLLTLGKTDAGPGDQPAADASPDPEAIYLNKTIEVTGKVAMYKNITEIKAKADDIMVEKN